VELESQWAEYEGMCATGKTKSWNKTRCPQRVNQGGNLSRETGKIPVGLEKKDKKEIVH